MEPLREWAVVVEAPLSAGDPAPALGAVHELVSRLARYDPKALYGPDRYALQLQVSADGPPAATEVALAAWEEARRGLLIEGFEPLRVEVLTLDELVRECSSGEATISEAAGEPLALLARHDPLHRALHDSVTDLPGAGLLHGYLEEALAGAPASGAASGGVGVLRLDLDDFGAVIRRWGRLAGDQVLRLIAARVVAAVEGKGHAARLGADQFAVILPVAGEEELAAAAERILAAVRRPIVRAGVSVEVTTSVGTTLAVPGSSAEDALVRAAVALVAAKERGKNRHERYRNCLPRLPLGRIEAESVALPDGSAFLGLLEQVAVVSSESTRLEVAARYVIRQVCVNTGWPLGVLYAARHQIADLVALEEWHARSEPRLDAFVDRLLEGTPVSTPTLRYRALASGEPQWSTDAQPPGHDEGGLSAVCAFPVKVGDCVEAVLEFYASEAGPLDSSLMAALGAVATQLGRVVERARSQAALALSEESLREAVTLARLGRWQADLRTLEVDWSPEVEEILGVAARAVPRTVDALWELVHPDDRSRVEAEMTKVLASGEVGEFVEFRICRPDGEIRWVTTRPAVLPGEDSGTIVLHGTVQDITSRKRAEAERAEAEERLRRAEESLAGSDRRWRTLLGELPVLLALVEGDGRTRWLHLPWARGSVDAQVLTMVHPEDRRAFRHLVCQAVARGGSNGPVHVRLRADGGGWAWLAVEAEARGEGFDPGTVVVRGRLLGGLQSGLISVWSGSRARDLHRGPPFVVEPQALNRARIILPSPETSTTAT